METREVDSLIKKFIYSCSHDLRGPIASIKGLLMLAEEYPAGEDTRNCLKMIEACNNRMDKVIRLLQEFMINEERVINPEEVSPEELINNTVSLYQDQLAKNGIIVKKEIIGSKPWVVDHIGVTQMVSHLLQNAITFSDPGKQQKNIHIKIGALNKKSFLKMSDNGLGIPHSSQSKVFDIFYRAHAVSGTGIGLFLVKHLAEKCRAEIKLRSRESMGTSVMIRFPPAIAYS